MTTFLIAVLAFLVAITVLVAFHEYGHFVVARAFGIRVLRFSIGFGKSIFSYRGKKGTEYVVGILPFGGYVKMLDEQEESVSEADLPYSFSRKPVWVRMLVVLAGPAFNFVLAFFLYWIIFVSGIEQLKPVLGVVPKDTAAYQAGLKQGDEIKSVNQFPVRSWQDLNISLIENVGNKNPLLIRYTAENQSLEKTTSLLLSGWSLEAGDRNLLQNLGLVPNFPDVKPIIERVAEGTPAEKAGFKKGDTILAVAGKPVLTLSALTKALTPFIDKPVSLTILRDGKEQTLSVIPMGEKEPSGKRIARLGVEVVAPIDKGHNLFQLQKYSPIEAFSPAMGQLVHMTGLTYVLIYKMIAGQISPKNISGPVGIAEGAGITARMGIPHFLSFLALISIGLGAINLLPIPMLDGGHFLFYCIEGLRGKPLSQKTMEISLRIGLVCLLGLMMFAVLNDLGRLLS